MVHNKASDCFDEEEGSPAGGEEVVFARKEQVEANNLHIALEVLGVHLICSISIMQTV